MATVAISGPSKKNHCFHFHIFMEQNNCFVFITILFQKYCQLSVHSAIEF